MRAQTRSPPTCVSRSDPTFAPVGASAGGPAPAAEAAKPGKFMRRLLSWHRRHGRRDLPWLGERDPYRVWLSEIMLQQTQVATVLPYFRRFLDRFADVRALARAPASDVMAAWAGLGYYARARNLHACARVVVERHGGRFPRGCQALAQLPGIGRSTAGAIAAFCFDERAPVLDGNVKRVLARHWAIEGDPGAPAVSRRLWERAQRELPPSPLMARYTQAIMDLGATVCTRAAPACERCPVRSTCQARASGRVAALPAAPARRERPVLRAHVLVALAGSRVLLRRRPADGIWGGLLCLPEYASKAALLRRARSLGADPAQVAQLPPRRHALTHLTLELEPYLALAARSAGDAGALQWVAMDRLDQAGLPAPHRALLGEVGQRYRAQRA